jgi:hypothetical protein
VNRFFTVRAKSNSHREMRRGDASTRCGAREDLTISADWEGRR